MPTKTATQLAKSLDFEYANDFFMYLNDSVLNGNKKQAANLWKELNMDGRLEAVHYLNVDTLKAIALFA